MEKAPDPRARVEAYIDDWNEQWIEAKATCGPSRRVDFARWRELVRALDERHFAPGARSGSDRSFSTGRADHAPDAETITSARAEGDRALVETMTVATFGNVYYEYELVLVDGEWRIAKLTRFTDPPDAPLVGEEERARILAEAHPDTPLRPLPHGVELNVGVLFSDGREVRQGDRTTITSVRRVGAIRTASGILSVRDFGYAARGFSPLERTVPPGTYAVDVVVAFGRNAAVRIVLDPSATITSWHPAAVSGGGHVVGVDAGNVAIFDVASYVRLAARAKERMFLRYAERDEDSPRPRTMLLAMTPVENDCVVLDSGFGDGGYPCYWGADAGGDIAALVVDFLVLAEFPTVTSSVPWEALNDAELAHPALGRTGRIWMEHDEEGKTRVVVEAAGFRHFRVIDGDGNELVHSDQLSMRAVGDRRSFPWERDARAATPARIEVTVGTGYRHV